ncbi:hypothetical protein [Lysobacter sp. ESA13C]|uniref:hypothetical protein n=1 Tax=Lysobacter sp. ESA13C TaxID=2862676 RepID=UPI001CBB15E8|nr:hypothetical protein [Lysobacter sp. ESA13C]
MNNAQKLNAAIAHVEHCSAELLRVAYNYGRHDREAYADSNDARSLYESARRYSDAVRSLARRARAKS